MSKKILSIGLTIVGIVLAIPSVGASLGLSALAVAAIEVGIALTESLLLGPGKQRTPSTSANSRLFATLNTTTPRLIVFGDTAGGTDIRYQTYTGSKQEFYEDILAVASHKVNSIYEIWFDNEKAWSASGGVQGRFVNFLTVDARNEGTSANAIAIDGTWTSSCRLTGCAYVHLKYKLTGPDSTTSSPFQGGVTPRVTIRTQGAFIYDPRLDSTVTGGSGSMRADDQTTWVWSSTGSLNPALQLLFYLLGWKINGKLAVGMGIPPARIDLTSFITGANICDEAVSLAAGGTQPRYQGNGVISEGDDRGQAIDTICSSMNAMLRDWNGKISLDVVHNDLGSPIADFTMADVVGNDEEWVVNPPLTEYHNIVRGKRVDPSDAALYQQVDYPERSVTSPDGIDRIDTFDLPMVQNDTQAERLANMRLQRGQYQGRYTATFGPRAQQVSVGKVVTFTHSGLNFSSKLFRVVGQTINRADGTVKMILLEENSAIYAWSTADEGTSIAPGTPVVYNPANNPVLPQVPDVSAIIAASYPDGLTFSVATTGAVTVSNHSRVYSDKTVSVTGATAAAPSGAVAGDVVAIYYDQQDRSGGAVSYQSLRIPGGVGSLAGANASSTNPYRHFVCAGTVPASGTTSGGSDAGSGGGSGSGGAYGAGGGPIP